MMEEMQAVFPAVSDPLWLSDEVTGGDDEFSSREIPGTDVHVVTSGGRSIPAHSSVLASGSPVLEKILMDRPRKHGNHKKVVVPILGVPCNAVLAFLRYLYSSRCAEEEMDSYGVHLLVLSHVFRVSGLKQACAAGLAERLTAETVVDVLQVARLCDAPRLYVRCMKLVAADFRGVEQTEGWRFLQDHDPWLELELLQFLHEADLRQERRARNRKAQSVYVQLSEAMECLQHIYTEGCTEVGPRDRNPPRGPCGRFRTCQGLQRLIRHFATCEKKKLAMVPGGGCAQCKRMWQLLRLHASVCDHSEENCRVPLCKQFKLRMQLGKKGEDGRWRLLVTKVVSAKVISSLFKRKKEVDGTPPHKTA